MPRPSYALRALKRLRPDHESHPETTPGNRQSERRFQILEERSNWHARAFEQPLPADLSRDAFNCGTLSPIEHDLNPVQASGRTSRAPLPGIEVTRAGGADTGQTPIATESAQLVGYGIKTAPPAFRRSDG
jgi:hypothetical protein